MLVTEHREKLVEQYGLLALTFLRTGLNIFQGAGGDLRQVGIANLCLALEHAANHLIASECLPAMYGKELDYRDLRVLCSKSPHQDEFTRVILTAKKLGFYETLDLAEKISGFQFPISLDLLRSMRNQSIHGVLLSGGPIFDGVAVSAISFIEFLDLVRLAPHLGPSDDELVYTRNYVKQRASVIQSVLKKLARAEKHLVKESDRVTHAGAASSEKKLFVECPVCHSVALFVLDPASLKGESLETLIFHENYVALAQGNGPRFFVAKIFTCPGCQLSLSSREVMASKREFRVL